MARNMKLALKKLDKKLLDMATAKANAGGTGLLGLPKNDYVLTLFKGMTPGKMSDGDRALLNDYLGFPDGTTVSI